MLQLNLLCTFLLVLTTTCEAYKVLVVFPSSGKSHKNLGDGMVKHLLEAGHEVTYITSYPNARELHPLLREIDVSPLQKIMAEIQDMLKIEDLMKEDPTKRGTTFIMTFFDFYVKTLEHEAVKKLINDPKENFDVVIGEWMFNELFSGIAAIYDCPMIWLSTVDPHWAILKLIDEIPNPSYTCDIISNAIVPFTFRQRVEELVKISLGLAFQHVSLYGLEKSAYEKLLVPVIQKRGLKVPDFEELRYNSSLILGNSHVSMGSSIRLPQNYKDVGGFHVNTNVEHLPKEFKELLDKAKNGLIYFSMGSNLRSKEIPKEIKADLLKMFGRLNQTVLWKFEEDLPDRPSNVHVLKWAPQQQILAHPNCILFITHGGYLSTTEAIHFGKPIIGIPVFGDQFSNVNRAVHKGFAKRVDMSYTMATTLENEINDILTDPSYSRRAKMLSLIYHDRPIAPGKELAHWVEHVVRTGGAPHLRSPALFVPWYQKAYLDLAVLVVVILYFGKLLMKKLICAMLSNKQKKTKTQ